MKVLLLFVSYLPLLGCASIGSRVYYWGSESSGLPDISSPTHLSTYHSLPGFRRTALLQRFADRNFYHPLRPGWRGYTSTITQERDRFVIHVHDERHRLYFIQVIAFTNDIATAVDFTLVGWRFLSIFIPSATSIVEEQRRFTPEGTLYYHGSRILDDNWQNKPIVLFQAPDYDQLDERFRNDRLRFTQSSGCWGHFAGPPCNDRR